MKALLAMAAAALLSAPSAYEHGPVYAGMPPLRLQGDGIGVVAYVSDLAPYCGKAPPGYTIYGCHRQIDGVGVSFLLNPCTFGDFEFWARIACHEAGHRNGWSGNHEL